jgi:alkylhydroperoxidase family enzyme
VGTGITDEQLEAIDGPGYLESDLFSERERLAIAWAESVTLNRARSDTKLYAQLEASFTTQEIVELTFVIAMFNMINRVNESLHVDVEDEQEIVKIRSRLDLDEDALRAYVKALADSW